MKKPSVFTNQQIPNNIYDSQKLFKFRINERYYFTQIILCQQKINFHIGFDFLEQKQVLITSFIDKEQLKNQIQQIRQFCLKILWKGVVLIKRVRYFFIVLKKIGCFVYEALYKEQQKLLKWFFLVFKLFIQYLFKVYECKGSLKDIKVQTMLLAYNTKTKKLQLKYWNKNLQNRKSSKIHAKTQTQKYLQLNLLSNKQQKPPHKNQKIWKKQQFKQVLQQMKNIKSYIYQNKNQSNQKQNSINLQQYIQNILQQFKKNEKMNNLQDWISAIQNTAKKSNIVLIQFQEQAKFRICQIQIQNRKKIHKLCQLIKQNNSYSQDCEQEDVDLEIQENQNQQIQCLMSNHVMTTKFMNYSFGLP